MATMYQPDRDAGIPPILVIDRRDLPLQTQASKTAIMPEGAIIVIFPHAGVPQAFRHDRGRFAMLANALCRSIRAYFARVNRGHTVRQRNL